MTEDNNTINFYSTKKEYGFMSNFHVSPFELDNKVWKTTEQYYQAMKFESEEKREKIRLASTASQAAKLGRTYKGLDPNWDNNRDDVMRVALNAKFTQHDDLKEMLLATNNAHLVEDSPYDSYWGCGRDGRGKNMLGIMLEELREELRASSNNN